MPVASLIIPALNATKTTPNSCVQQNLEKGESKLRRLPPPTRGTGHGQESSLLNTTVNVENLASLLGGFDKKDFIIDGFTHGFRLHFEGPDVDFEGSNSSSVKQHPTSVDEKIAAELAQGG